MKFNCGESKCAELQRDWKEKTTWHKWFAWFPVRISESECVWLEIIEQKYNPDECNWEFRTIEVSKDKP